MFAPIYYTIKIKHFFMASFNRYAILLLKYNKNGIIYAKWWMKDSIF